MLDERAAPTVGAPSLDVSAPRRTGPLAGVLKFIRRKPLGAFGFLLVFFLFAMTLGTPKAEFGTPALPDRPFGFQLGSPWMERYNQEDQFYTSDGGLAQFASPSTDHIFGTDRAGRDIWSRIVVGARRSLFVGIWALVIATLFGSAVGVISGYFGKWLDTVVQRFADAIPSFPP